MRADHRVKVASGMAVIIVHAAAILLLLLLRSSRDSLDLASESVVLIAVAPERTPEKAEQSDTRRSRPRDAAAPPNLRAEPTAIVALPPIVPLPSPVIAAPLPARGTAADAGAAALPGPGAGAGGQGDGRGGGGEGGNGAGYGGTPPRWRKGRIKDSDYPPGLGAAGISGTVGVRYRVGTDGRPFDCMVEASSGSAALDDTTCHLIESRFRFYPARDDEGRPVVVTIVERHSWLTVPDPPAGDRPRP
jgi:periplasmic protein TonB